MEADLHVAVEKKSPPRPIAFFMFRGEAVAVELTEDGGICVRCPVCGQRCAVNLRTHDVVIHMQARKAATIYPSVSCPSIMCGWRVIVVRGIAFEVDDPIKPEPPEVPLEPGQSRCVECGRAFRPGGRPAGSGRFPRSERHGREVCQRCTNNQRGTWSTKRK